MNDFLDNLGAHQYEKMRKRNAIKEEIINTCEETYYDSQSEGKEFKDSFYSPEEYGTWQTQTENTTT